MEIKGAIFDLDGTLLDSMWVWNQVDIDFLGNRGFDVPPDYPKAIAAMGFHETAEYTIKRFDLKEKVKDVIAEWDRMAAQMYHERDQTLCAGSAGMDETAGHSSGRGDRFVSHPI